MFCIDSYLSLLYIVKSNFKHLEDTEKCSISFKTIILTNLVKLISASYQHSLFAYLLYTVCFHSSSTISLKKANSLSPSSLNTHQRKLVAMDS
jgi:hypothetical protein